MFLHVHFACMCVCVSHSCLLPSRPEDPLELESQPVMSYEWVLRIKPQSSGKASCILTTEPSLQLPVRFLNLTIFFVRLIVVVIVVVSNNVPCS